MKNLWFSRITTNRFGIRGS